MTVIHDPVSLILSGNVRRWHSHPDMCDCGENLAEHQWLTAMIVLIIEPTASYYLLVEALTHDVGELTAGDLSYPFKKAYPDIAMKHRVAEHNAREMIISQPEPIHGADVLRMADYLAGWVRVMQHAPQIEAEWRPDIMHLMSELDDAQARRLGEFIDEVTSYYEV